MRFSNTGRRVGTTHRYDVRSPGRDERCELAIFGKRSRRRARLPALIPTPMPTLPHSMTAVSCCSPCARCRAEPMRLHRSSSIKRRSRSPARSQPISPASSARSRPDVIVGLPTLGLTLAAATAQSIGHHRYVPLGTSRKFWYDESLSVSLSSITSPDVHKRLYIDPRMLPLIEGRRVALIDDVISSGVLDGRRSARARALRMRADRDRRGDAAIRSVATAARRRTGRPDRDGAAHAAARARPRTATGRPARRKRARCCSVALLRPRCGRRLDRDRALPARARARHARARVL